MGVLYCANVFISLVSPHSGAWDSRGDEQRLNFRPNASRSHVLVVDDDDNKPFGQLGLWAPSSAVQDVFTSVVDAAYL
jgi:hypothetical protein